MSGLFDKLKRYVIDKKYRFDINAKLGLHNKMSDEAFLKTLYRNHLGKELNLDSPTTYNEKIQWLKIHDRKPEYTMMVDKVGVKSYVADKIGEQYIIPTIGVWDKFDEIDFDKLPNRFVLKTTHDSGGVVICKDKNTFNIKSARKTLNKFLKRKYYQLKREWPYKDVKPRIICEEYMEDSRTSELRDYKFFCFSGKAKMIFIASDRQNKSEETKFDFFDMEYNHLPFTNGHPNAKVLPERPQCFSEMRRLAEILSENIPHVRVDFYEVDGRVYFGELTFSHWSGLVAFDPEEWDTTIGSWIKLPKK